jgi:hypothetical protein
MLPSSPILSTSPISILVHPGLLRQTDTLYAINQNIKTSWISSPKKYCPLNTLPQSKYYYSNIRKKYGERRGEWTLAFNIFVRTKYEIIKVYLCV